MLWNLEHGAHEETVRELARVNQMPLPDWLENKPTIRLGLEFYWKAFWELSTCRSIGMGEGPIPWSAMNQYAGRYEIEEDEFDRFVLIIKAVDCTYLEHRAKKTAKTLKTPIGGKTKTAEKPSIRSKG